MKGHLLSAEWMENVFFFFVDFNETFAVQWREIIRPAVKNISQM